MGCFDDYITIDRSTPSRSGLYAVDLPGVSLSLLDELTDEDQEDYLELWEKIYTRATNRLVSDFSDLISQKFLVEQKLTTRETSQFTSEVNEATSKAGVKITFELPKYAKLHVISVGVVSGQNYTSPLGKIQFFDTDENGDLLMEKTQALSVGKNTINVDTDFDVDEIFIAYDPEIYEFRKTENKYFRHYAFPYDKLACTFPCYDLSTRYRGTVNQVSGGGINVKFVIQCSVEKLICENINLFKQALWWAVGYELVIERRLTDVMCRFTTMTLENAEERETHYKTEFDKKIATIAEGFRVPEDGECFACNSTFAATSFLP